MSVGSSGRIVIEIEPEIKRELYSVLSSNGQTLKEWFLQRAAEYMRTGRQISMFDRDQSAKASQDANLNLKG